MNKHKPQLLAHIDKIEHEVFTHMDLLMKDKSTDTAFVMPLVKPLPDIAMENTR